MQEKLNVVLTKIKNGKAARLDEIPPEVWKKEHFDNILLQFCITWNSQEIPWYNNPYFHSSQDLQ